MTTHQLKKQNGHQEPLANTPLVSIFTCVYKTKPNYLCAAVESILNQDYQNWEYRIIDACPNDPRKHIIQSYLSDPRIKYEVAPKRIQFYQGANLIIPKLKGKYIGCLDHDDVRYKDNLSTIVSYMEAHPEYGFVGGWIDVERDENLKDKLKDYIYYPETNDEVIAAIKHQKTPMCHSIMLMRRNVLDLLAPNYYMAAYNLCPENQLYIRVGTRTKFHNIQKVLGLYRYYQGNNSTSQAQEQWCQYCALWRKFNIRED